VEADSGLDRVGSLWMRWFVWLGWGEVQHFGGGGGGGGGVVGGGLDILSNDAIDLREAGIVKWLYLSPISCLGATAFASCDFVGSMMMQYRRKRMGRMHGMNLSCSPTDSSPSQKQ